MPRLRGALLVATSMLLVRPVHGHASRLVGSNSNCGRSITVGNNIMGAPVQSGSASIKLQKGGTPIPCSSSLTAGDTGLTFALSGQGSEYVVEAIASAGTGSWGIQGGKCNMQRQDNTASNTYTVPATDKVTVRVAWASSYGPVSVSTDCEYTVTAASTPSSSPTTSPSSPSSSPSSPPASPPASPLSPSSSPTKPATATPAPVAILSAAEKAVAPKVVSKISLDRELTATEQISTKSGYAAAAGVPVENVEMSKDARRQSKVSYSVTVYVKDAAAAAAVSNKLSDPAVVKSALIAAGLPASVAAAAAAASPSVSQHSSSSSQTPKTSTSTSTALSTSTRNAFSMMYSSLLVAVLVYSFQ